MSILTRYIIVLVTLVVASGAAYGYYSYVQSESSTSDVAQVRITVAGLGDKLQQVPLIAPSNVVAFAMDKYYSLYVNPDLLTAWKKDPTKAPGRLTSSPWPDRIDITGTTKNKDGTYTVNGSVIEVAKTADGQAPANNYPVRFVLTKGPDGWQITGYEKL
jgi:hypothetical protein